jgi:hypothetical protein
MTKGVKMAAAVNRPGANSPNGLMHVHTHTHTHALNETMRLNEPAPGVRRLWIEILLPIQCFPSALSSVPVNFFII